MGSEPCARLEKAQLRINPSQYKGFRCGVRVCHQTPNRQGTMRLATVPRFVHDTKEPQHPPKSEPPRTRNTRRGPGWTGVPKRESTPLEEIWNTSQGTPEKHTPRKPNNCTSPDRGSRQENLRSDSSPTRATPAPPPLLEHPRSDPRTPLTPAPQFSPPAAEDRHVHAVSVASADTHGVVWAQTLCRGMAGVRDLSQRRRHVGKKVKSCTQVVMGVYLVARTHRQRSRPRPRIGEHPWVAPWAARTVALPLYE